MGVRGFLISWAILRRDLPPGGHSLGFDELGQSRRKQCTVPMGSPAFLPQGGEMDKQGQFIAVDRDGNLLLEGILARRAEFRHEPSDNG